MPLNDNVKVTVVGTGMASELANNAVATTAGVQPNIIVEVVGPIRALVVRFIHAFLVTFGGAIGAGASGILPASDLETAAKLALAAAAVGFVKDLVTVFGRLENKYPLITGNV